MEIEKLKDIKNAFLMNNSGKIEGQRLSEKWFAKRGISEVFSYLQELGISNSKDMFDFENPGECTCECGSSKRFIGYRDGYKEYCEPCGRSKNNVMKRQGIIDIKVNDVPEFVSGKNGYSSTKIKRLSQKTVDAVTYRTSYIKEGSLAERIYHIEHGIFEYPICPVCGSTNTNFYTARFGYKSGCSLECNFKLVDYETRTLKMRDSLFAYNVEKYNDNCNLDLCDNYIVKVFTKDEYVSNKDPVLKFTHNCGFEYNRNISYQGSFHCPDCFPVRSKNQYEVYRHILKYIDEEKILYDKRKTLDGSELDIEIKTHNIAIEYNGIEFHSFGKNSHVPFNNYSDERFKKNSHLIKTEQCEEIDIQLFHIFSNEWKNNRQAWESVLENSLGKSNRIFARKTLVKEVSNKEAKEFQELNHLQGSVNASIKLGLYYNDELVSLMTFGKSRYSKDAEYELLRFCNKLNTQVTGGASKLLKYFERNYNPRSLISYANRRWSRGNLYDKLGFEFSHNTKPNYFYFKTGSDVLESRVKFQKHKLRYILETFNPDLTETENMYNNDYRKIYDSGNKVYIKTFNKT